MLTIKIEPLTKTAFEPFGDVIEIADDTRSYPINNGTTQRFHNLATAIAIGEDAHTIISMVRAQPFTLPLSVNMVERHPDGSQAFVPVQPCHFVVIVAHIEDDKPAAPHAFLAGPGQGINYFRGTWHGVLTALDEVRDFLVVDRDGDGDNLEEYFYPEPFTVAL